MVPFLSDMQMVALTPKLQVLVNQDVYSVDCNPVVLYTVIQLFKPHLLISTPSTYTLVGLLNFIEASTFTPVK